MNRTQTTAMTEDELIAMGSAWLELEQTVGWDALHPRSIKFGRSSAQPWGDNVSVRRYFVEVEVRDEFGPRQVSATGDTATQALQAMTEKLHRMAKV